jgi:hypothetical protein
MSEIQRRNVNGPNRRQKRVLRRLGVIAAPLAMSAGLMGTAATFVAPPASAAAVLNYGAGPIIVTLAFNANGSITIHIVGGGFRHHIDLSITVRSTPEQIGTTMSDANGNFAASALLPSNLAPGEHTVTVSGDGVTESAVFTLPGNASVAPSSFSTPAASGTSSSGSSSSGSSGPLAFTGTDVTAVAAVGGGAIAGGGLLVMSSRKRRRKAWNS